MVNFVRGATRIYAPAADTGPDRGLKTLADGAPQPKQPDKPADSYLSALLKLVPAEIISIYMPLRDGAQTDKKLALWFFICLAACIIFRAYSNLPQKADSSFKDVQWRSVLVAAVAFFLWAYAIGPEQPVAIPGFSQWLASGIAAVFGLLAPLLVPGDTQQTQA